METKSKFNEYDYIIITKGEDKINSYIYKVNTKLKTYKIFNDKLNQFENISWESEMEIKLVEKIKKFYYAQPIEYLKTNNNSNDWILGFVKDFEKNNKSYIIVSDENFFNNQDNKYDEIISKDFIRPIININNVDKYLQVNQVVVINNNLNKLTYKDFGRIIGINTKNNNYEYFIKFQNYDISYFSKEEIKKSDFDIYFVNDIVLYKDLREIIHKGIIYNISKNYDEKNQYDIIKIDEINGCRLEFIKNIDEKYIIKFIDIYLPSSEEISYCNPNTETQNFITYIQNNNYEFFKKKYLFPNTKYYNDVKDEKYLYGYPIDYVIGDDEIYLSFVSNFGDKNYYHYNYIKIKSIIPIDKLVNSENLEIYADKIENFKYKIGNELFVKINDTFNKMKLEYIDYENQNYYFKDLKNLSWFYKINLVNEDDKIIIKKNNPYNEKKSIISDEDTSSSEPLYEINDSSNKKLTLSKDTSFPNYSRGNINFKINEEKSHYPVTFLPNITRNRGIGYDIYCVSESESNSDSDNSNS